MSIGRHYLAKEPQEMSERADIYRIDQDKEGWVDMWELIMIIAEMQFDFAAEYQWLINEQLLIAHLTQSQSQIFDYIYISTNLDNI